MKWEIKKFIGSRFWMLIIPLVVLVNAFLFSAHLERADIQDALQLYENSEIVPDRTEQLRQAVYSNQTYEYELTTDNIYDELNLYEDVLLRIESVDNYSSFLDNVLGETRARIHSGFFGSEGGFKLSSLYETENRYASLKHIKPEACFSYPFELLSSYNLCDAVAVLIGISMILILFCQEAEVGTLYLIKPTRNGHANLFSHKYFAVVLFSEAVYIAMYLCSFIIVALRYGFTDFSLPVQSLYSYLACPYNLSIGAFALSLITTKIFGIAAVLSLCIFLGCVFKRMGTIIAIVIVLASSYAVSTIPNNILRYLNILSAWNASELYEGLIYLNIFGVPISRLSAVTAFSIFIILIGFSAAMFLFLRKGISKQRLPSIKERKFSARRHLNTQRYETRKLLISCSGIIVILAFICIQVMTYSKYSATIGSTHENMYREYSVLLAGEPNTSKDEYLNSESKRFDDLRTDYSALMSAAETVSGLSSYADSIRMQLDAEPAFLEAKEQYEQLEKGQYYIYKTPYELLYNGGGLKCDVGDIVKLLLALSISLPFFFCMEYESKVLLLINSIGALKNVNRLKKRTALLFSLICTLVAFAPRIIIICVLYGLPQIDQPANNLQIFSYLPDCIEIWMVLIITLAVRLLIAFSAVFIIFKIAKRSKHSVTAIMLSLLLLLGIVVSVWIIGNK